MQNLYFLLLTFYLKKNAAFDFENGAYGEQKVA